MWLKGDALSCGCFSDSVVTVVRGLSSEGHIWTFITTAAWSDSDVMDDVSQEVVCVHLQQRLSQKPLRCPPRDCSCVTNKTAPSHKNEQFKLQIPLIAALRWNSGFLLKRVNLNAESVAMVTDCLSLVCSLGRFSQSAARGCKHSEGIYTYICAPFGRPESLSEDEAEIWLKWVSLCSHFVSICS